jgi:hypothetical protein
MEDRFTKYSKLYFLIAGAFLLVQLVIALIIGFFYGFLKIFASRPLDVFYELLVMGLPPALFAGVYYLFIRRTKKHPYKPVKIISQFLMIVGFCSCMAVLVADILYYVSLKFGSNDISNFKSFSLAFMAGNIALMFVVALLQAFTTPKEEDWVARRKRKEGGL